MSVVMTPGLDQLIAELDKLDGKLQPNARADLVHLLRSDAARLSPEGVKALVQSAVAARPYLTAEPPPSQATAPRGDGRMAPGGGFRFDGSIGREPSPAPVASPAFRPEGFGFSRGTPAGRSPEVPASSDPRILPGGGIRF